MFASFRVTAYIVTSEGMTNDHVVFVSVSPLTFLVVSLSQLDISYISLLFVTYVLSMDQERKKNFYIDEFTYVDTNLHK